jgi:hypothetical protein
MCLDVVKQYNGMWEAKRLIIAISIGYPDDENIVITLTNTRDSIERLTSWIGFP